MTTLQGRITGQGKSFAVVVSRFNEFITRRLLTAVLETFAQAGVRSRDIKVVWVPGALEIPFFVKRLAASGRYHAVVALACVLRGETFHFECVAGEVTRGISQAALETGVPVASGVITADGLEQAIDRAGLKAGNKGQHAALAALEIADLNLQVGKGGKRA